jgi:hypothetical protein
MESPFGYENITDIETRARVQRAVVLGGIFKNISRKISNFLDLLHTSNEIAGDVDYYLKNPSKVKF